MRVIVYCHHDGDHMLIECSICVAVGVVNVDTSQEAVLAHLAAHGADLTEIAYNDPRDHQ